MYSCEEVKLKELKPTTTPLCLQYKVVKVPNVALENVFIQSDKFYHVDFITVDN